jgi:AsmA protein
MASHSFRRLIRIAAVAVVLVALAIASLPLIASTQIVRDRIAQELSALSGYRVTLADPPKLAIWPAVTARLSNVSLSGWTETEKPPVLEADEIAVEMSVLAALSGRVVIKNVRLIRPDLRVKPSGDVLYKPSATPQGRLSRSVERVRTQLSNSANNEPPNELPADGLGTIAFTEGRILIVRDGKETEAVTGLSGRLDWPQLNRPVALAASGIWRGESFALALSSARPIMLLAGGNASLAVDFKAAPLNASFEGEADLDPVPFFNGKLQLSSPSLRRMLEWSRAGVPAGTAIGSVKASSTVTGDFARMKFENTEISLDGNRGLGVLDLTVIQGMPALSGTLAFGSLDLNSLLSAFTPLSPDGLSRQTLLDARITDRVMLDLRLSATQASAGRLSLTNVAAAAQVKPGLAVFDISDATAFGGSLQAGLRIDQLPDDNQVEIRLLASDVDAGAFATLAGLERLKPETKAQLSVILKGRGASWPDIFSSADGTVSLKLSEGRISGLDLNAFAGRLMKGGFFELAEVGNGTIPIRKAEMKASVSRGIARIETAEAANGEHRIVLAGVVPYLGRGLALSGSLIELAQGDASGQDESNAAHFFVGGTWTAPIISPVLPVWQSE